MPALATPTVTVYKKRFLIRNAKHWYSVATEAIACFVLEDRYVTVITLDRKQHPIGHSLEHLESLLNPEVFFRINRHSIVSYAAIAKIEPWFNSRLRIEPVANFERELIVSRSRTAAFKEWLDL